MTAERMTRDDLSPRALALLQAASDPAGVLLAKTPDREAFALRIMVTGLLTATPPLVTITANRETGEERVHASPDGLALLARPTRAELAARRRRIVASIVGAALVLLTAVIAVAVRVLR